MRNLHLSMYICIGAIRKKVLVAQSCLTLCHPMECRPPESSVHGILQARVLEWLPFPSPGDLPNPGIEAGSPAFQADALTSVPPGKPIFSSWFSPNAYFLVVQMVKHLSTMRETQVQSLGWEDPLEKEAATTPVLLPGESHGWRSLLGYSPRGGKESDTTERLHFNFWNLHEDRYIQ